MAYDLKKTVTYENKFLALILRYYERFVGCTQFVLWIQKGQNSWKGLKIVVSAESSPDELVPSL